MLLDLKHYLEKDWTEKLNKKKDFYGKQIRKIYFYFYWYLNLAHSENLVEEGKTVESDESMVVTRHFLASRAGNEILMKGGNAVDASIAISFALSVVLPQASPIGGGGFMIIHDAKTGSNYALDYREMAPKASTEDMFIIDGKLIES